MNALKRLRVGLALALAACASPAWSELVSYDLILTIDEIQQLSDCRSGLPDGFGCLQAGMSFRGSFAVDSTILATDGINSTAAIYDFSLPFGSLVYSTGADNTALRGFRNPVLGAAAPGFVIEAGEVVDLVGGVYGSGDVPFIDMFTPGFLERNHFRAYDGRTFALGTLSVSAPVPTPDTVAIYAMGLGLLGFAIRRRAAQR